MRAWLDGRLLERPDAPALTLDDHGLTVGNGVFETLRAEGDRVFALERHLARLGAGARAMGLPEPDEDAVRAGLRAVLGPDPAPTTRLRVTLTGGPSPLGYRPGATPRLAVLAGPLPPIAPRASVVTASWPRNERSPLAGVKTTSYAEMVLASAEARAAGADEAVFADTRGRLCEGAGSNVVHLTDGELRTPSPATGCLPGVTRALLVEWCDVRETADDLEHVRGSATALLLTSTVRGVQPVASWDGEQRPVAPAALRVVRTFEERAPSLLSRP